MGALQLSGTTAFSSRTKHICTRYHFLRELVASDKIIVSHFKTTDQLVDIFSKFLDYPNFKAILDKIINFASWATLQDHHQYLHHQLYWGLCVCYFVVFVCSVCSTSCLCFRLCAHIHAFQVFDIRDFYQIDTLGHEFLKHIFWMIGLNAKCLRRSPG